MVDYLKLFTIDKFSPLISRLFLSGRTNASIVFGSVTDNVNFDNKSDCGLICTYDSPRKVARAFLSAFNLLILTCNEKEKILI